MKLLALLTIACIICSSVNARLTFDKFKVTYTTKLNGKITLSYAFQQRQGLTKSEKQAVIDVHNTLRNYIALGKQKTSYGGPMPPAANMLAMEWDDRLAEYAQNWVNSCPSGHSPLNIPSLKSSKAQIAENMCGDYTSIIRDMYGEVKDWNYRTQSCRPDAQCGHYMMLASWSHFRIGCGWKVCQSGANYKLILICNFAPFTSAGNAVNGVRPTEYHEYVRGPPCSDCPQGWDYCLGGGLCATKKQCESKPNNPCKCLNDKATCEANGGIFDAEKCRCKCRGTRYGLNCKHRCSNPSGIVYCGMTCGNSLPEIVYCYKSCGWCGKSKSRLYTHFMTKFPNVNSEHIATTVGIPTYDVARNPDLSGLPSYGKCTNRESNQFCENVRLRHYCNDVVNSAKWHHYCGLSCNSCGSKAWTNQIRQSLRKSTNQGNNGGWTNIGTGTSEATNGGWATVGGGSTSGSSGSWSNKVTDGGWTNAGGASASGNGGSNSNRNTNSGSVNSGESSSGDSWDNEGSSGASQGSGASYGGYENSYDTSGGYEY